MRTALLHLMRIVWKLENAIWAVLLLVLRQVVQGGELILEDGTRWPGDGFGSPIEGYTIAEVVFATGGARPDLDAVVKRADEQLGADADVLIGGPQPLIDGLEDRLRDRIVERMTWAM